MNGMDHFARWLIGRLDKAADEALQDLATIEVPADARERGLQLVMEEFEAGKGEAPGFPRASLAGSRLAPSDYHSQLSAGGKQ